MNLFKIEENGKVNTPYFEVKFKVDENDGDYKETTLKLNVQRFAKYQAYYYLLLFADVDLEDFPYYDEAEIPYGTFDRCNRLKEKSIYYFDEQGKKHDVTFTESLENTLYALYKANANPINWIGKFDDDMYYHMKIEEGEDEDLEGVHRFETIDWNKKVKEFRALDKK